MDSAFSATQTQKSLLNSFFLLLLLVLPIYSNAFHAGWQFDDRPRILNNNKIHITVLSPESIQQVWSGNTKRFLPYLSFALNWYAGGKDPFGYHLVNVSFHIGTAFLLYLTLLYLFRTPALEKSYRPGDVFFIAFFGAALWAVNPVQTQAVTYIVQRMALMAAFFYLAGLFFYLKARLERRKFRRAVYFLLVGGSFVCAMFSKENAVMLPVSLGLVELFFFSQNGKTGKWKRLLGFWGGIAGIAALTVLWFFQDGDLFFFLSGYENRPFTLGERVLTEPRIIWFYLSLLVYPVPARLSVAHDVVLSQSLFSPWTTSLSLGMILFVFFLAWRCRRRYPLLSFAACFFFVNHFVESTVVPLELIFEHRNYLPSFFLFLPVTAGVRYLVQTYRDRNKVVAGAVVVCLVAVVIGFGRFTYDRNRAWKSHRTLWMDALSKTKTDARPVANMALTLAWGNDATWKTKRLALGLLKTALQLNLHREDLSAEIYGNMASLFLHWGNYERAVELYQKGLQADPGFVKNRCDLIQPLFRLGRLEEALSQAEKLVDHPAGKNNPDYYNIYGFLLLWQQKPARALDFFQKALDIDPYNFPNIILNTGCALSRAGHYARAEWFYNYWFHKGRKRYSPDMIPFFLLIENSERSGNHEKSMAYAKKLLAAFNLVSVLEKLRFMEFQRETVPLEKNLIAPVIYSAIGHLGREETAKKIF